MKKIFVLTGAILVIMLLKMIRTWCKPLLAVMMGAVILLSMSSNLYVSAAAESVYLSDMKWVSYTMCGGNSDDPDSQYSPGVNETYFYHNTINIAGVEYDKGLCFEEDKDTPADIAYNISGLGYKTFSAIVGKDLDAAAAVGEDGVQGTLIQFYVLVDDVVKADSGILKYSEIYTFKVDITGASKLTIRNTNGGDGQYCDTASWGNPILSSGSTGEVVISPVTSKTPTSPIPTQASGTQKPDAVSTATHDKTAVLQTSKPQTTDKIQSNSNLSTGTIITIVVAGLIGSAAIIGLLILRKIKKNKV